MEEGERENDERAEIMHEAPRLIVELDDEPEHGEQHVHEEDHQRDAAQPDVPRNLRPEDEMPPATARLVRRE